MRLTQPHLIPNVLDYEMIKAALQSERFEEIAKVGRYFLRFDPLALLMTKTGPRPKATLK